MIDEGLQMIDHSKKIKDNIDLGKESSLANYDNMIIRGGVKLT